MGFFRRFDHRQLSSFLFSLAASTLVAAPCFAHNGDHFPIAGGSLKMSSSSDPSDNFFKFKSSNQISINPVSLAEDPRSELSSLIVRGTGAFAGSTEIIQLSQGLWSRIGSDEKPKGWKYSSDIYDSHSGGVTKIQIKSGKNSGALQIQAKGYYWPFDIVGEQDSVEVVLTIGGSVFCAEFSQTLEADFKTNLAGEVEASSANPPAVCPKVCGNGVLETGEQCDDANDDPNDTCNNECVGCDASDAVYDSTYEGIQQIIFDGYDCSNAACHGSAAQGGLNLTDGNSYASLVNVASQIDPETMRVFPGDQDLSVLYLKLAHATVPDYGVPVGGSPMPFTGTPLTADHLEAVRLWIRGGAPETGVVAGTAERLGSCLPPPTPLNIPQPAVPDPTLGTQLAMPGYDLEPGEVEGCVATYYDISASVPDADLVDCPGAFPGTNESGFRAGKCFSYRGNELYQDAQSHHSIVHIYPGTHTYTDPGWGGWTCYEGPTAGAVCDPGVANACGTGGVCGSHFHKGVACLPTLQETWGAPDFDSSTAPQFSGSQESTANFSFPEGVYSMLPLKGLVVWNSHAFNLTTQSTIMNEWINLQYTADRTYAARGLFDSRWIFTEHVPAFEQREYCATHTFAEGTHLFSLTSHNHKHGIRFRYFDAPQSPPDVAGPCYSSGGTTNQSCTPGPTSALFFTSYEYSDALNLHFDPPKVFSGDASARTIKFCSLYDNGFNDPSTVKRRSLSPVPTGNLAIGGPCDDSDVVCLGGTSKGQLCHGNDSECPGSVCDACPLKGGVTTEDEMFISLGTFYIP